MITLEEENNFFFPNSPTKKVGYQKNSQLKPFVHSTPVLSLNSVNNCEGLIKFDEKIKKITKKTEYLCE